MLTPGIVMSLATSTFMHSALIEIIKIKAEYERTCKARSCVSWTYNILKHSISDPRDFVIAVNCSLLTCLMFVCVYMNIYTWTKSNGCFHFIFLLFFINKSNQLLNILTFSNIIMLVHYFF